MPDTILLDKNVLTSIARNNTRAAMALRVRLDMGDKVYISRAAYDELVTRAQTPKQGGEYEWLLNDARITIAPKSPAGARFDAYADNIQHVPAPGQPQLKDYSRKDDPSKPGDIFVVAEAKSLKAELWSFDAKVRNAAPRLGVALAPESNIGDLSGPEDVAVGRKLLGLPPRAIGADGKPVGPPASGGPTGGHAIVGVADDSLPETGGPSAKGVATINGIQLAFEGVNFVLNLVNDAIQKKKVEEALNSIRGQVSAARTADATLGVLLLFFYTQYQAPEESIIKPGAAFDHVTWGKGVTRDEALRDALSTPTISRGTGPNENRFSREVWIPPLQASAITTAKAPFKPYAIGQFFLGDSAEAKFQIVTFDLLSGFDDIREKGVDLPGGRNAQFAVLDPPSAIYWYNMNGRQSTSVPLKTRQTANGNSVKVVDLDPWLPTDVTAAPIFPLDDYAQAVFNAAAETGGAGHALSGLYVNFSMMRWIRPYRIHLLKFL